MSGTDTSLLETIDFSKMIPQGTLDHVGRDMRIRQRVLENIKAAFERFGFSPYETPILENVEAFQGRYGEGEGSIFHLSDKQHRNLVLPYDSTVSLARVIATHPELPQPYRAYNIGKSFRDEIGDGFHQREITQCAADVVGSKFLGDDAEFIVLAHSVLKGLGFSNFTIRINHRKIYQDMAEIHGIKDHSQVIAIQRAIDHFDQGKGDMGSVKKELADNNIGKGLIDALLQVLELSGSPHYVLHQLEDMVYSQTKGVGFRGLNELREIIEDLPRDVLDKTVIDLSLVRDLDYYTGFVIEGAIANTSVGSVMRGGRYDDLISSFGAKAAAVGMAFYFELILEAMKQLGMLDKFDVSRRRIFLSCADQRHSCQLLKIGQSLRRSSFEVVTAHEPLINRFKRLKAALAEQCAFVVWIDGMLSVKPLPGYGDNALFKVLQEALESDAYGDGVAVAIIAEEEVSEFELNEIKRLGQPAQKFDSKGLQ